MTRLYYDDPLAAAYMAREFGVRLGYPQDNKDYPFVEICDTRYEYLMLSDAKGKYYIHPDSLAVFEPKEGDLVWNQYRGEVGYIQQINMYPENPCVALSDNLEPRKDDHKIWSYGSIHRIIQRDNKQFFMAKREE